MVSEVEAGYRAYRALNDYETAVAAGDREAAGRHLLEFGTALTEAVPLGGRFAKAGRFAPALDKAREKIGKAVADLTGAGPRKKVGQADRPAADVASGDEPSVSSLDLDKRGSLERQTTLSLLDQGSQPTCGSTCVGMILKDMGKDVDLDDLAKQSGVRFTTGPNAGTTLSKLASVLRQHGVGDVRSEVGVTISQLAEGTLGKRKAIVQVMVKRGGSIGSHAVVVDGVTMREGQRVVSIRDPALGDAYHVPVELFEERMRRYGRRVVFVNPTGANVK